MSVSKRLLLPTFFIFILIAASAYLYYSYFKPTPRWDHASDVIIITTSPGPMHIDGNYIPDLQIWGDGYIIWVEYEGDGSRIIKEGILTEEEVNAIIARSNDLGIFTPFRNFVQEETDCDYSGFDNQLDFYLLKKRRSVLIRTATPDICEFAHFLVNGAGLVGSEYHPTRAWLYTVPIERTDYAPNVQAVTQWPDESPFVQLADISEGNEETLITGEVLNFAWQVVNDYPHAPIVTSRESKYWIAVLVPDIQP